MSQAQYVLLSLSSQILTAQSCIDHVEKTINVTGDVTNKKVFTLPKPSSNAMKFAKTLKNN